jgi:predicted deacylase
MDSEILNIDNELVERGETKTIRLLVGRLPSDTRIYIQAHVFRSKNPGPVVLCLGGVHGDEINGVEILRKSIELGIFENLNKGTVIAIPLLNVFGFINFSRDVPDGKDVNRSFPGNMNGSLASRMARTMTKKILPVVDYALDFHTGGSSRYNYPQIRYTGSDKMSLKLALAFDPPFIIKKGLLPKSFRKACKELGIPAIVYEGGESIRLCGDAIDRGMTGIQKVLESLEMASFGNLKKFSAKRIKRTTWVRAKYSGLFIWTKKSGQYVTKSEPIGVINDPFGMKMVKVLAPTSGYIIGHNNASVVNQGDALFHIGYELENNE